MTKYHQILRLHSQGISQRSIAQSCGCSRNTVAAVLQWIRMQIWNGYCSQKSSNRFPCAGCRTLRRYPRNWLAVV